MKEREVLLSVEGLSKRYGEREILSEATFGLNFGDRVGLIGDNGTGKSTLLKLLCDADKPDTGRIAIKRNIRFGYLPQDPDINPQTTIFEHIYNSDNPDFQLLREYHRLSEKLAYSYSENLFKEQQQISEEIERKSLWTQEQKALSILNKLGFSSYSEKIQTLSGGQKRRVDLARVLTSEPEILLLDEPTNHLDTDVIEWLQDYVISYPGAVIFVTHDRYFLDAVSTRVAELEKTILRFHSGNYSDFLKAKELQVNEQEKQEKSRLAILRKELKWLSRGAKARTSKPKHHVDRVMELIDKSYLTDDKELVLSFPVQRMGKTILEVHGVTKSYGDLTLFQDFSHSFQKYDRIGIIGRNGTGKTTFLKLITQELSPDTGHIKKGLNTFFAYFRQENEDIPLNISVIDYIRENAELIKNETGRLVPVREMLERFNFDAKEQQRKIHTLSGGERKRLYLLKSLMFGANFIVLDEPTNDFDIKTLEILEDYLDTFQGSLLVVSHDRFFLDRTVDYLFVFDNTSVKKFTGNYSDYLLVKKYFDEEKEEHKKNSKKTSKKEEQRERNQSSKKISYKVVRELALIESEIAKLEERREDINQRLACQDNALQLNDYKKLSDELCEIEDKYIAYLERWELLSSESTI